MAADSPKISSCIIGASLRSWAWPSLDRLSPGPVDQVRAGELVPRRLGVVAAAAEVGVAPRTHGSQTEILSAASEPTYRHENERQRTREGDDQERAFVDHRERRAAGSAVLAPCEPKAAPRGTAHPIRMISVGPSQRVSTAHPGRRRFAASTRP